MIIPPSLGVPCLAYIKPNWRNDGLPLFDNGTSCPHLGNPQHDRPLNLVPIAPFGALWLKIYVRAAWTLKCLTNTAVFNFASDRCNRNNDFEVFVVWRQLVRLARQTLAMRFGRHYLATWPDVMWKQLPFLHERITVGNIWMASLRHHTRYITCPPKWLTPSKWPNHLPWLTVCQVHLTKMLRKKQLSDSFIPHFPMLAGYNVILPWKLLKTYHAPNFTTETTPRPHLSGRYRRFSLQSLLGTAKSLELCLARNFFWDGHSPWLNQRVKSK
jgi:hypothetical protein